MVCMPCVASVFLSQFYFEFIQHYIYTGIIITVIIIANVGAGVSPVISHKETGAVIDICYGSLH